MVLPLEMAAIKKSVCPYIFLYAGIIRIRFKGYNLRSPLISLRKEWGEHPHIYPKLFRLTSDVRIKQLLWHKFNQKND